MPQAKKKKKKKREEKKRKKKERRGNLQRPVQSNIYIYIYMCVCERENKKFSLVITGIEKKKQNKTKKGQVQL